MPKVAGNALHRLRHRHQGGRVNDDAARFLGAHPMFGWPDGKFVAHSYHDGCLQEFNRHKPRHGDMPLREQAVELSANDFIGPKYSNPLGCAVVGEGQSLLVVNCAYTLDAEPQDAGEADQRLQFEIVLDSISFSLILAVR